MAWINSRNSRRSRNSSLKREVHATQNIIDTFTIERVDNKAWKWKKKMLNAVSDHVLIYNKSAAHRSGNRAYACVRSVQARSQSGNKYLVSHVRWLFFHNFSYYLRIIIQYTIKFIALIVFAFVLFNTRKRRKNGQWFFSANSAEWNSTKNKSLLAHRKKNTCTQKNANSGKNPSKMACRHKCMFSQLNAIDPILVELCSTISLNVRF